MEVKEYRPVMARRTGTPAKARRSHEERSSETRARLLDATIGCLVDLGYTGTSTTEVVKRAGLTRGAQVHHFPTKAQLVEKALERLSEQWGEAIRSVVGEKFRGEDRVSEAIDLLWSCYSGPLFVGALEFLVAARTDPELREVYRQFERRIRSALLERMTELFGPAAESNRRLLAAMDVTVQLMNGLALTSLLETNGDVQERQLQRYKRFLKPLFEEALAHARGRGTGRTRP